MLRVERVCLGCRVEGSGLRVCALRFIRFRAQRAPRPVKEALLLHTVGDEAPSLFEVYRTSNSNAFCLSFRVHRQVRVPESYFSFWRYVPKCGPVACFWGSRGP